MQKVRCDIIPEKFDATHVSLHLFDLLFFSILQNQLAVHLLRHYLISRKSAKKYRVEFYVRWRPISGTHAAFSIGKDSVWSFEKNLLTILHDAWHLSQTPLQRYLQAMNVPSKISQRLFFYKKKKKKRKKE